MPEATVTPWSSNDDDRRRALEQLLAQRGGNAIGSTDVTWDQTVAPVLNAPTSDRARAYSDMWSARNNAVDESTRANLGGYGAALDALRVQNENEALRQEAEKLRKKRKAGGVASGSNTPPVDLNESGAADPWGWVQDYVSTRTYSGAPIPGQSSGPAYNPSGGGKPSSVPAYSRSAKAIPYSKPKQARY